MEEEKELKEEEKEVHRKEVRRQGGRVGKKGKGGDEKRENK